MVPAAGARPLGALGAPRGRSRPASATRWSRWVDGRARSRSSTPTTCSARTGSPKASTRLQEAEARGERVIAPPRGQPGLRRRRRAQPQHRPGLAPVHAALPLRPQLLRLSVPWRHARHTWACRTSTATFATGCRGRTGSSRSRPWPVGGSTFSRGTRSIFKRRRDFSLMVESSARRSIVRSLPEMAIDRVRDLTRSKGI